MTDWQDIVAAHQERRRNAIPAEWRLTDPQLKTLSGHGTPDEGHLIKLEAVRASGLLSKDELRLTEDHTASELVASLASGSLRSVDVVTAFAKRAAVAHQLTNCLTEIFFEEAIKRAKSLDEYYSSHGKPVGPLHGLPMSLKDSFVVKGQYATVGYVEFLKQPIPETNSALVDLLLDAGAVLYCKTNVPQTMMTADSENNVFGRTLNPHNTALTAGGSTGGEGALLALRGSPLGIGTDIAGSIRIPAFCDGIYGFKPTSYRLPNGGQHFFPFPRPRLPGVVASLGPMGNSVEDLSLLMKAAVGARPWKYDALAPDLPWRAAEPFGKQGKMTVGVLPEPEGHVLHPPVRRALERAVAALKKAGHNVVVLSQDDCPDVLHASRLAWTYFGLGQPGLDVLEKVIKEPLIKSVRREGHPFSDGKFPVSQDLEVHEQLTALNTARDEYVQAWKQAWIRLGLDVMISPGCQHTAVPHDSFGMVPYTVIWNLLDYPAGIIPFGKASKVDDPETVDCSHIPFEPSYDPEVIDGAPTAIQVIAPRYRDEECLEAMRIIDADVRK